MLIFSWGLTPGRVKGSWIVLIWKIPACLKFGKTSILWPCCSARCTLSARNFIGIWCYRTLASACFFGNDRSSRSRVRTRLITKCVYYEWVSDSFAYLSPCNNSWYARAYPRVKKLIIKWTASSQNALVMYQIFSTHSLIFLLCCIEISLEN